MSKGNDKITIGISGPHHKRIPVEVMDSYKKLFETIKEKFPGKSFSRFFPMQGIDYDEKGVRLMLIGRSVNGWTELTEETADDFALSAGRAMINRGFSWLQNDGKGTETYIDEHGRKGRYNINKSSFFRCTKGILNKIKPETETQKRWFENIVWTNLYTVAPLHSGNAEGKLQNIQLEESKKLLAQQIKFYKPTHILFITDWEWWFDRFTDVFCDVVKIGDSKNDNVVGAGHFNNAKVIVTVRPDRTRPNRPNEEKFINDVVEKFNEL